MMELKEKKIMRILVVDDDPMASEMIAAVLESLGHAVVAVENALDACARLDTETDFALVVSDMHMPLVSGIEFLEVLRAGGNEIPFILLTGDDPATLASRIAGVDACLAKDFSLDESLPRAIDGVFAVDARMRTRQ